MNVTQAHRDALEELAPEFDAADIAWCLIKWPPNDGREHGDLDVLVSDGVPAAERIARDHGFAYEHDQDRYRRKYVRETDGHRVELDIHTHAAWAGVEYLPAEWITDTAVRVPRAVVDDVPTPSIEADLLIWAAHDMRENAIPYRDAAYCAQLIDEADVYACRCIAHANGWHAQFTRFLDLVDTIAEEPPDADPYRLTTRESTWLKALKLIREWEVGGPRRFAREALALVRFDLRHLLGRWFA